MLTTLKRWFSSVSGDRPEASMEGQEAISPSLVSPDPEDIERFLEAAERAERHGHSPWVMNDSHRIDTLRRALEFTLHRGVWLQPDGERVAYWQGQLLRLRHGQGPTLGMALVCRPDEESAWQLRFFFIDPEWQGHGHGARLLQALRGTLEGAPLQVRLPLSCHAAVRSLEQAGFDRMHVDAGEVVRFEASAIWRR